MAKNNSYTSADILGKKIIFTASVSRPYSISEGTVKKFSTNNRCIKIGDSWFVLDDIKILDFNEEEVSSTANSESIGFKMR